MADGPGVGYATLQVIPSMRGAKSALAGELERPLEKAGATAGEKSSKRFSGKFVAGIATVGAAGAAALVKGFSDAFGQEDLEASLQAQLGLDPGQTRELASTASGIYRDAWGDSLGEVGDAAAAAQLSLGDGFGASGLDGATRKALAFADVFDADVNEAISSAGLLLTTGLAGDADEAFDLMVRSAQEVPAALRGEVLDASNEYGRFFAQLGFSGPEAFGLLTAAADGGVFGIDKTGDALKELTIRATDMSSGSKDAFKAAGLNAEEMAAKFLAGGDDAREALDQTVRGLLSIEDPTKRANAAIGLFGTPLEDLGTEGIPEFLLSLTGMKGGLEGVEGSADDMVDAFGSTTTAKIESFRRKALGKLADFTADKLIPAFEAFAGWTKENWPQIRDTIQRTVGKAIAIFGDLRDAVTGAIGWLNDHKPVLYGIVGVVGTLLVGAIGAWTIATYAQVTALWAQAAAFAAAHAPLFAIAAVIGAVTAGVIYAYQNWDWFRNSVNAVASFLKEKVPPAFAAVVSALKSTWRWLQDVWDRSEGFRAFLASAFVTAFNVASDAVGWVVSAFQTAWEWAQTVWDRTEGLRGFMAGAFMTGFGIASLAVNTLVTAFRTAWGWAKIVWDRTDGFRSFLRNAFKTGVEVASGIVDGLTSAFGWLVDKIDSVISKIQTMIGWIDKIPNPTGFLGGGRSGFTQNLIDEITEGRARGGPIPTNRPFWVGEEGPELVQFSQSGRVFDHDTSMAMASGGGGHTIHVNNHRSTAGPDEIARGLRMARLAG